MGAHKLRAADLFLTWRGREWQRGSLQNVHHEVIHWKHREVGLIAGRNVEQEQALAAIDELLTLLEAYDSKITLKPHELGGTKCGTVPYDRGDSMAAHKLTAHVKAAG